MAIVLSKKLFKWASEVDPVQPLTSGIWRGDWSSHESMDAFSQLLVNESDVISFHNYNGIEDLQTRTSQLKRYHRPMLCTEYMARPNGSHFDPHLSYMQEEKVAAYNWGFVSGKSQTIYAWQTWKQAGKQEPTTWFHDIFRADGTPFSQQEVNYIRSLTRNK